MRALLLAAGRGTRLRPVTDTIPKCLVPVAGRPLLQYWLERLFRGGIERVLINTHYLAEQVVDFIDATPWRDRIDRVHEDELLGTAGTLRENARWFGDETGFLAHADNLTMFDVRGFLARHRDRPEGVAMTMMTFESDRPSECGIVEQDTRGVVTAFHEKIPDPPSPCANAAVYIFEPSVMRFVQALPPGPADFSNDVVPYFVGRIVTWHNEHYHRDIGTPESLARAQEDFARRVDVGGAWVD